MESDEGKDDLGLVRGLVVGLVVAASTCLASHGRGLVCAFSKVATKKKGQTKWRRDETEISDRESPCCGRAGTTQL